MIAARNTILLRTPDKVGGALLSPVTYHVALATYFVGLWFLRLWLFPAGSADDAEQLFLAQSFELGYKPGQPPLYTWIVWLAEQAFGTSLGLVVAIKYVFLWATHVLAFELARRVTNSAHWGAFAGLGVFGIYYLSWDSTINYSQTVLIAALAMAGVIAARAVVRRGTVAACIALGLIVGIGIANKYNFGLFGLALVGAVLLDAEGRRAFIGKGGVAFVIALVAVPLPHFVWLLTGAVDSADLAAAVPAAASDGDAGWRAMLMPRLYGLLDTVEAVLSILMPFLVFWLIFFPRAALHIGPAAGEDALIDLRLIERLLLIFVGLVLLMVAAAGLTEVRNHWFIVIAPFVAYATLRTAIVYGDPASRRAHGFAATMALLAVAVMIGLTARSVKETADCDKCKMVVPYEQLAEALREAGFDGGTLLAADQPVQVAGNLRPYLPDARFESLYFPDYRPPENETPGECLAVWLEGNPSSPTAGAMASQLRRRFGVEIDDPVVTLRRLEVAIDEDNRQSYAYFLIEDDSKQSACK